MTKAELVKQVAAATNYTQKDVDTVLDALFAAIKNADRLEIRGFGVFKRVTRQPKVGRNPQTGETINIPAKTVLKFKATK